MLGKLIKYEFKATGRILLPLYGALLVFALINRLLFRSSLDETINNTFGTIGGIANILSVFAYGCTNYPLCCYIFCYRSKILQKHSWG